MRYNRYWNKNGNIVGTDHTWQLAAFTEELTYEKIPAEVLKKAKALLISIVGAALASREQPLIGKMRKLALEGNCGEGGATTAWGSNGMKLSALNSVMIAGAEAHFQDWDDNSWTGHPASAIVPAAIITAEEKHRSGKEVLTAIVAAYEVYQRIAMAVQPTEEAWKKKGWGQNSWQIFASAIAAAKIYGFDARKIDQTIGVCAESSPLGCDFAVRTGSDFYFYEFGLRIRDGLLAVKAVDKGIWNCRDTMDEQACYYGVICDTPDTEWFTKDLGRIYLINESCQRKYPAGLFQQGAIDAIKYLMRENNLSIEDIKCIVVDPIAKEQQKKTAETLCFRQQSAAYIIAENLINGKKAWFGAKKEEVNILAEKIQPGKTETDIPALYTAFRNKCLPDQFVEIYTSDGEVYSARTEMPAQPGESEIKYNFIAQIESMAGEKCAEELYDKLLNIEKLADAADLAGML